MGFQKMNGLEEAYGRSSWKACRMVNKKCPCVILFMQGVATPYSQMNIAFASSAVKYGSPRGESIYCPFRCKVSFCWFEQVRGGNRSIRSM